MDAPAQKERRRVQAIGLMLLAVVLFAVMDTLLKTLSPHYSVYQVTTLRALSSLPLVLTWAIATVGVMPLLRVRWSLHLLRGALGIVMMATFIFALKSLPLSTTYSIFFLSLIHI